VTDKPCPTLEELLEGEIPLSLINEPIVDFVVDFARDEPKRESATARAMRLVQGEPCRVRK
jgi:hypothetical protein